MARVSQLLDRLTVTTHARTTPRVGADDPAEGVDAEDDDSIAGESRALREAPATQLQDASIRRTLQVVSY